MSMAPHILILTHPQVPYEGHDYYLEQISTIWQEQGIKVTVQRGPGEKVDADVAIVHVDATHVPPEYTAYVKQYPVVLNGGITDISKRHVSRHLVRRGDGYTGPVIVKTNGNYGGQADASIIAREGGLRRLLGEWRQKLPWYCRSRVVQYPIYASPAEVPKLVWLNPDLVVERFLTERDGEYYCLRTWLFLGDREGNSLTWSSDPIVKTRSMIRRVEGPEAPPELRQIREELKFDFGKFDYGIVNGKAVLYDTNTTPTWAGGGEAFRARALVMAEGIKAYLPRMTQSEPPR